MCGIAGIYAPRGDGGLDALEAMTDRVRHRGPDDRGTWTDPAAGIGLGHRRLSIIDLSPLGHQPMCSASGRHVLVFNGEIYNFRELAAELQAAGVRFRGQSDTEVLLEAIDRWGLPRAVGRCAGMFAFALWDRTERTLHLVRDRIGEKPLYYRPGRVVLFGSELKALAAHPTWRGTVDRGALAAFLRHGYVPAPRSIYEGVRKVRPGTIVSITAGAEPAERAYWSAAEAVAAARRTPFGSEEEAVEALDVTLRTTVRQVMIADVPLGAFLSGGIDSSLVVALMQASGTRPVHTYTVGFRERRYNEAEYAQAVAAHLGTAHTESYLTAQDALDVIPRLPGIYDEPFADASQVPTYLVAAMARRHVTVCLSGDGGDELFGGYARYAWGRRLARWRRAAGPARPLAAAVLRAAAVLPGRPGDRARRLAGMIGARDDLDLYRELVSVWRAPSAVVADGREPAGVFDELPDEVARWPLLDRMMYVDLVTYLPDDIFVKVDRAGMASSLETRAPFVDHRIVEQAWRAPACWHRRNGTGKRLTRRLLERYVPRALFERPKRGFEVPMDAWLRGPLRDWADDLLDPAAVRADGLLRAEEIARVWERHRSGARDWGYLVWPVLMFRAWREGVTTGTVP